MNIKEKIEQSGLTKQYIAGRIGKTPQYFSMMLNGKAKMSKVIKLQVLSILDQAQKISA